MWPRPQDHLLYVFTGACSGSCCFGDNVFYLLPMGAYLPYTFWYICILHLGHLSLKQNFVDSIIWDSSLSFTHLGQHSLQPVTRDYIAKGENKIVHRNKQLNASILEHFFPTCQVRVSKLVFFPSYFFLLTFFFSLLFLVFSSAISLVLWAAIIARAPDAVGHAWTRRSNVRSERTAEKMSENMSDIVSDRIPD